MKGLASSCFDNYDASLRKFFWLKTTSVTSSYTEVLASKNLIIFVPGSYSIQEDPATRGRLTQLLINVSNGGTAQRVPSLQDGPLSGVDRKLS